ncbi:subtilisin-like protein [Sodiomyces alkalinus F11]|uniref:Subtilisin-like protein n=1 Tax=Sodiomyces alkalinus (strain CBS 110278 / VKM F-3762 / F11) TaxID=1314773 RepID=A0A3N2PP83_SODAK|nr:subtilisin-like protein [Sodiomyces alkalinus F11]ROT36156.1 subtilisin-like protein [Sodiomyces alkalinus F11]
MVRGTLLLSLFAAATSAVTAKSVKRQIEKRELHARTIPGAYIIEFHEDADPTEVHKAYEEHAVKRRDLNYKLFKGTSIHFRDVETAEERALEIGNLNSVKHIYPVEHYERPHDEVIWRGNPGREYMQNRRRDVDPEDEDEFAPHLMTQVDRLRDEGFTGAGLKVAVIDTGIDYTHPALGGCFGRGCLVSYGMDFVPESVADVENPDNGPLDCDGHGTHVAGTIAAQSNPLGFEGGAPGVELGAYKVFGCSGGASTDILIASFNQAYEDGSDIISASIGGPNGWTNAPWASAVTRIMEKGVACLVAAGNEGETGIFYASSGSSAAGAMAVGSFEVTDIPIVLNQDTYTLDGSSQSEFGWHEGLPQAWADVSLPLYALSSDTEIPDDACDPLPADTPDLSHYIVLIRRGTCDFAEKAANVAAHGAQYVMFYNNEAGISDADASEVEAIQGAGMVTAEQGEFWISALHEGSEIVLHMSDPAQTDMVLSFHNNTAGGYASEFTTWGPTWDLNVKPQFSAPGGKILSTYPLHKGSYSVISGTSMATPLVAAAVALIAEARGTLDPVEIMNLLASTAKPQLFHDSVVAYDYLAPVAQQGSGIIQAYDAAYATVLLSTSSLAFNDSDHFVAQQSFKIRNTGSHGVTYQLSNVPASTAYTFLSGETVPDTFPNEMVQSGATLRFGCDRVVVPAGEEVEVTVEVTPPAQLDEARLPVWSGFIQLAGDDGSHFSVAYQGVSGSIKSVPVLQGAHNAIYVNGEADYANGNETYVLPEPHHVDPGTDRLPGIAIGLSMGSELVHVDLVPLSPVDPDLVYNFFGHETIGAAFFSPLLFNPRATIPSWWDGELDDDTFAPAGRYKWAVRALRIFGDPLNADDYEYAESEPFTIRYTESHAIEKKSVKKSGDKLAERLARLQNM